MTPDDDRQSGRSHHATATASMHHDTHQLLADTSMSLRRSAWARTIVFGVSSFTSLIIGIAYIAGLPLDPPPAKGLLIVDSVGGIQLWAIFWLFSGAMGFLAVISGRRARLIVVLQASLAGFWAICYFLGWLLEGGRGYLQGSLYLLIDVLTLALLLLPWDRKVRWPR